MRDEQYSQILSMWINVRDDLGKYKQKLVTMLDFAEKNKTQVAYLIGAYLREVDELMKEMWLYKPYSHFNYPHYYRKMRMLTTDTAEVRATVDFLMSQFPNYPNYP